MILFPEGTRNSPEKGIQPFANSCGLLSVKSGAPIIPICHNSGMYWKNRSLKKVAGKIAIIIGQPINGSNPKEVTEQAQLWISQTYKEIS